MQDRVAVSLSPGSLAVTAGDTPASVDVTVSNRSAVVDQYDLTLSGGQPDWYEIAPARVSLFPGESTTAKLSIHPPRRTNVLAGSYRVVVRAASRDDSSATGVAGLELTIRPSGGFQLQLIKAHDEGRSGSYRLRLANLSDAALRLSLAAQDPAATLTFFFPSLDLQLAPYEESEVAFSLRPRRRRFKGEPQPFPFEVSASPQYADQARSAREAQRSQGEFVYKPYLRSWPWEGLPKLVNITVPLLAAGAALSAVLVASGAVGGHDTKPPEVPNVAATLSAGEVAASATAAAKATATQTPTLTPTPTASPTPAGPTPTPQAATAPSVTHTPAATSTPTHTPTPRPPVIINTVSIPRPQP